MKDQSDATKVLLVDDDVELTELLCEYLAQEGFEATAVHDGESGVVEALSGRHSIAVLDVMMPHVNGIEALRRIRSASRLPVLMLTARGDDIDRVVGLELGADDYVPKPCTPRELVARLRAILRRTGHNESADANAGPLTVGALQLWRHKRQALWRDQPLELTSAEFSLIDVLARNAGEVVSKSTLCEQALGRPLARFDRSIDVHLSSIRRKLGLRDDGKPRIETVRGRGYQLVKD